MKKAFNEASINVLDFARQDIITSSGDGNTPVRTPNNDYIDVSSGPKDVIPD